MARRETRPRCADTVGTQPAVCDMELEYRVAWWERLQSCCDVFTRTPRLIRQHPRIPGRDDVTARMWIFPDVLQQLRHLVYVPAIRCYPVTPLRAINWSKLPFVVGPFVPNGYAVCFQVGDIRVTPEKPQQFVDDGAQMQFLGGNGGETLVQVETKLVAKQADRPGSSAVRFAAAISRMSCSRFR